jgi:predicted DNA-binding transcriptional regulator YafY
MIRDAVATQHWMTMVYTDAEKLDTQRLVRPLGCFYWGRVWTLVAWCETRKDFRSFRIDRIRRLEVSERRFRTETGKTLADFLRTVTG